LVVLRLARLAAANFAVSACIFAQTSVPTSSSSGTSSSRALTDRYCAGCHSQKAKTGGVVLEGLDWAHPGTNAAVLEKVIRKVQTGEMPPPGLPRPDAATSAAFTKGIEEALDKYAAANPNPGRPAIHRLNRAEYSNAIRDLLALDTHPGATLPVDDSGYGFDNIGDVLSVSPALLERYMSSARAVSRMAVGDPNLKAGEEEFSARRGPRNERISDDLPFDSRGGISFSYYFPLDAEYRIRVKLAGGGDGAPPAIPYEVRIPVKAGLRTIGVTFLREAAKPEISAPAGRRGGGAALPGPPPPRNAPAEMDLRLDGARLKRFQAPSGAGAAQVDKVLIAGPYNVTGRGDTPSREKIFVCRPPAGDEDPCAQTILAGMARRAFRRPVADADIKPLMAFYKNGRAEGDFDHGVEKALRAMLVSPDFLYRIERDPHGVQPGTVYRVGDFELASRLSFFLWSSIPDDELLGLAEKGQLKDPSVLEQQVRRMLADPRSQALVSNFGGQWLYLRNLAAQKPDPEAFPEFDESLRQSFEQETTLFFQSILREDRSLLDLLDADYTYLNQRLAEHYGIPDIYGSQLRRVTLNDPNRGGLLGQGSVLTVTSYPNRTSIVQRGKWILETLLGSPPPPPPPGIPDFQPKGKDGRQLSMRESMEQHRANSTCASCHSRMDPLGFALENYDGVGKWRTEDAGAKIDPSGKLPDGTKVEGPASLKKVLVTSHKDEFLATATQKLLMYALGRGLEYYDQPSVRAILRESARDNYRFSALVTAIVKSTPFQMRRTPES
jgi:mono/diheme cytochrome c family protein